MDDFTQNIKELDISKILQTSLQIYKAKFTLFIGISLCAAIANEVCTIALNSFNFNSLSIIFFINILVSSVATILLIDIASYTYQNKQRAFNDGFAAVKGKYWRFVAISVTTIFIFGLGLLLFVVPGIYLITIFIFADILIVLDNAEFLDAFKKSYQMVKPHIWKVMVYVLIILGVSSIPGIMVQFSDEASSQALISLSKVLSVLIMPFFVVAQVSLYHGIKSIPVPESF